jgi:hypothetical protein
MAATINADNGVSSGSAGLKSSADSSGVLQLQTNGTAAVTVDTSQNVGIGTSSPNAVAGQTNVEVVGSSGRGNLTLNTTQADGTGVTAGTIAFRGGPSTSGGAEGRIALIASSTEGATANNRGGYINFNTKVDNGTLAERMRIDSSGNVGIGTISASTFGKFAVAGADDAALLGLSSATGVLRARAYNTATTGSVIESTNAAQSAYANLFLNGLNLLLGTGNTERMRITSAGNVGIGTDSPADPLVVRKDQAATTRIRVANKTGNTAATAGILFENSTSDTGSVALWDAGTVGAFTAYGLNIESGGSGGVNIGASNASGAIRFATGGTTERARIDSSGNVGIGTSSPRVVSGYVSVGINGTSGGLLDLFSNGNRVATFGADSGGTVIGSINAAYLGFTTNGTERARIDTSGNLLVGTTAATGLVVAQRNTAGGYSAAFGARAIGTAQGQVAGYMFLPTFTGTGDNTPRRAADIWAGFNGNWTGEYLVFGVGTGAGNDAGNQTVERMRIDAGGNLTITGATATKASGTTWANPSDQRLKDNIRDYVKGTTELMQVRVREWEYNGKGGTTEGMKGLGVIADEVMTVLPSTVENYDAKLNADDEETTAIKKFDATEITWLLVKTVQEQQAVIAQLQADVATFKGASA